MDYDNFFSEIFTLFSSELTKRGISLPSVSEIAGEDNDPYRVIKRARINVPKLNGNRVICVKAVDVFGFESATTIKIN